MSDAVNHPSYYNRGSVEVIDFIEDWRLDFSMGSFVKYICRAGHKDDRIQDLEKAKWYIKRFADHMPKTLWYEGTYDWWNYAASQGASWDLCHAMASAYELLITGDKLNAVDAVWWINQEIDTIKEQRLDIEQGVIETGSEQ